MPMGIPWPDLDEDLSIGGMLRGGVGSRPPLCLKGAGKHSDGVFLPGNTPGTSGGCDAGRSR